MGMIRSFFITGVAILLSAAVSRAEEAAAPAPPPAAAAPAKKAVQLKKRGPKGKQVREKEIEGSEARNRFQADTVLKSQYQQHGESLEVDPD